MRLRLIILCTLAVATVLLAVLGAQATAAPDVAQASACTLLKSALKKEEPLFARRLRLEAPVLNVEVRCLFTDTGRLAPWKWFAEFIIAFPAPSAAVAKRGWQKSYAAQRRIESEKDAGIDVTRLVGYGADNAFGVVVTDAKRDRNKVDAVWQKGVFVGTLTLAAPRSPVLWASGTDEVEELLPVLMRGIPRTYP